MLRHNTWVLKKIRVHHLGSCLHVTLSIVAIYVVARFPHRPRFGTTACALHAKPSTIAHSEPRRIRLLMLRARGSGDMGLETHNKYQESTFDSASDFFASPEATPPAMIPRMRRIAASCRLNEQTSILDVATGTGALLPFFEAEGATLSELTGVDLSAGMMKHARARFPTANFVQADILSYVPVSGAKFDRVVFNAVFGNLYDQAATLRHVANTLLKDHGLVIISHPLGRHWLREVLHKTDPLMVPHDMPGEEELRDLLSRESIPLSVVSVDDDADYFCAVLQYNKQE